MERHKIEAGAAKMKSILIMKDVRRRAGLLMVLINWE